MTDHMIQQFHVYDYLGKENDPLYIAISIMEREESQFIPEIKATVQMNQHGLYEIASKSIHESYTNKEALYDCVNNALNYNFLRGK
ncbi:hypothetical protein [Lentibacillus salicampi]|uniref:Uncharacterized protein n=1 Tax=Lentibacillus salicampi TaxID=175306 RepID=A0A4Y9AD27_9BACI|nr:hypothetical protein [Lentibacillus salicampi]TFJ92830.1 hypothetical protein E4U82_09795 [Lentibacillus salicampi]